MASMYEANLVGKRQEILDEVFNVESDATPFLSRLKTGSVPKALLSTWVDEILPDAPATGILDGAAASTPGKVDRYLLSGCSQHFRREWGVTTLAQLTEAAGVKDEAARQMLLGMKLLKRMIEVQALSNDDCTAESGGTPWTMRGVFPWLQNGAQTNYPVPSTIRPAAAVTYDSTMALLTESAVRTMLEAAYAAVKNPVTLEGFVGYDLKAVFDDFTNIYPVASTTGQPRTAYRVEGNNQFLNTVDMVKFSAGTISLMLDPFVACTTSTGAASAYTPKSGVFLNMKMWDIGYMQKPANTNLAPDGSGKKGYIDAVAIVRCKNPLGQLAVLANS